MCHGEGEAKGRGERPRPLDLQGLHGLQGYAHVIASDYVAAPGTSSSLRRAEFATECNVNRALNRALNTY
jgi:hypothetical protein